jgi:glutathione synthase/RimK-type ligase-like ATP-grasp enzyme
MTGEVRQNRQVPRVLLATFSLLPGGEPGGELLVEALARRGVDASWVRWDDPAVDWADADLVAVRATWDYHRRLPEFLAWARAVDERTRLLNGSRVFAWNADKAYLLELADWLGADAVVPTVLLDDATLVTGLGGALERWGSVVLKPAVGASGIGVVVADVVDDIRLAGLTAAPWLAQPLIESVRTVGETSVYVFGGRAVAQFAKRPADGEIRVQEEYGGTVVRVPLGSEAELAERAVAAASSRLGADLAYARVDLMEWAGRPVVSELELIEPGLYLDVSPVAADPFADLLAGRL